MNTVAEVLDLIVAKGVEYTLIGEPTDAKEYADAIIWHGVGNAPTWSEIQAGFVLLQNQSQAKAAEKTALLARLGLTDAEAKLLLS